MWLKLSDPMNPADGQRRDWPGLLNGTRDWTLTGERERERGVCVCVVSDPILVAGPWLH